MSNPPRLGPPWLPPFLSSHYFSRCPSHGPEQNHFCTNCSLGPLCLSCLKSHPSHSTLQVRKASHFDAIRVVDIQKLVDISGIQTYSINNAKIVFLLARPRCKEQYKKEPKDGAKVCLTCQRNLVDPMSYCSIGCKLSGVRQNRDDSSLAVVARRSMEGGWMAHSEHEFRKESSLHPCEDCEQKELRISPILKKRRCDIYGGEAHGSIAAAPEAMAMRSIHGQQHESPPAPKTPPSMESASLRAGHRRKGTPHRAPLQ